MDEKQKLVISLKEQIESQKKLIEQLTNKLEKKVIYFKILTFNYFY